MSLVAILITTARLLQLLHSKLHGCYMDVPDLDNGIVANRMIRLELQVGFIAADDPSVEDATVHQCGFNTTIC